MHIYKKAYFLLIWIGIILAGINTLIFCKYGQLALVLLLPSIFIFGFIVAFFRIPNRIIRQDEKLVYSPADGKIVAIEEVFEGEYLESYCKKISIFMSVFNVHQNRVPVSGKVVYSKHHPGKYLVAWHPKSSLKNERHTVVIETSKGKLVLIRQIAGFVARRIICNLKKGDEVKQGDELGFIMFGSRVDVFLPSYTQLFVDLNEQVKGNISTIGNFYLNV